MPTSNLVSIIHLPRRVSALGATGSVNYRMVYLGAVNGLFPTVYENGRWYVDERDIPRVAAALGIRVPEQRAA